MVFFLMPLDLRWHGLIPLIIARHLHAHVSFHPPRAFQATKERENGHADDYTGSQLRS
jgi:hypothetical protein